MSEQRNPQLKVFEGQWKGKGPGIFGAHVS